MMLPLAQRSAAAFARRLGSEEVTGSAYAAPETGAVFCQLETLEAIGSLLEQTWRSDGLASACVLIAPLLELVEDLVDERLSDDLGAVTPYIYTLF